MSASYLQAGQGTLAAVAASVLLAGCVHTTPDWDAHFGDATRIALVRQVADPQAPRGGTSPAGMDGQAAAGAYGRYQKSFSEPAPQPVPLVISTGGAR
jgi:hypothetical protein